jgi:hypothetical protein
VKRFGKLLMLSLLLAGVYGLTGGAQPPPSTSQAKWELLEPSPASAFSNAVAWAIHDGGLWSIGGVTNNHAARRYDPTTDTWTTHAVEPEPWIQTAGDACYGLNKNGHEIVVLFPSTSGGDLHIYNITRDAWSALPPPASFPPGGLIGHDIVTLYNITGENVCYISGGFSGAGLLSDLWEFLPDTRQLTNLGSFDHATGFRNHASWYIPWGGEKGSICVGGGEDGNGIIRDETQCYDIAEWSFSPFNVLLGPLPAPWAYMADGWKIHEGRYQIWLANGLDMDHNPFQASAYLDPQGAFVYGPAPNVALFNTEGDGCQGDFYVEQGASADTGAPSTYNLHLVQPPEPPCQPEVVFFEDFEDGFDTWDMTGLWNPEIEGDTCGSQVAPFPSSNTAAYYGRDGECDYDTGDTNEGYVIYASPIDLTYHTSATLTFWSYEQTECLDERGNCGVDLRLAEISANWGKSWNPVWGSKGPEGEWYQAQANLAPYAGKTLLLRFRFDSDNQGNNDHLGWLVDDVTVTGCRSCQQRWHGEPRVPGDVGEGAAVLEYDRTLLFIGGSDSGGNSYSYLPAINYWQPLAPMDPTIQFPEDGAIGQTPGGPRAFILGDSIPSGPEGAMIYDITTDTWIHDTGFPVPERYAHDMAEDRDNNLIYVTGGLVLNTLDELWIYDPWNDSATQGPDFSEPRFHHASWYVPWLGTEGYLCIAGGTGEMSGVEQGYPLDSTQCYDIAQGNWRTENADLGPLPEPWTRMGDAVKMHNGCPQLWIVGGIMAGEPTTRTLYFDLCDDQWHWGEDLQLPSLLSSEAVAVPALGDIYAFPYDAFTQHHLQPCPARRVYLPLVLRNHR